jgi:hypothetical protein
MLQDEVADDIEALANFDPNSEEYKKVAENICKLIMEERQLEITDDANFCEEMIISRSGKHESAGRKTTIRGKENANPR